MIKSEQSSPTNFTSTACFLSGLLTRVAILTDLGSTVLSFFSNSSRVLPVSTMSSTIRRCLSLKISKSIWVTNLTELVDSRPPWQEESLMNSHWIRKSKCLTRSEKNMKAPFKMHITVTEGSGSSLSSFQQYLLILAATFSTVCCTCQESYNRPNSKSPYLMVFPSDIIYYVEQKVVIKGKNHLSSTQKPNKIKFKRSSPSFSKLRQQKIFWSYFFVERQLQKFPKQNLLLKDKDLQSYLLIIYLVYSNNQVMSQIKTSRVWKQLSHIKADDVKDSESLISHSRSSSSFQFKKVSFSKNYKPKDGASSFRQLAFTSKAKQKSREHSILNDSRRRSRENSFAEALDKQSRHLSLTMPSNRKIEIKMKSFLKQIKELHEFLRRISQSLLSQFQRIKEELQHNLEKILFQVSPGRNSAQGFDLIKEVLENNFSKFRKTISILPQSLTNMDSLENVAFSSSKHNSPKTPKLNLVQQKTSKNDTMRFNSIITPKESPPSKQRNLSFFHVQRHSTEKDRPITERKKGLIGVNASERQFYDEGQKKRKRSLNSETTKPLEQLISEMRQILES